MEGKCHNFYCWLVWKYNSHEKQKLMADDRWIWKKLHCPEAENGTAKESTNHHGNAELDHQMPEDAGNTEESDCSGCGMDEGTKSQALMVDDDLVEDDGNEDCYE